VAAHALLEGADDVVAVARLILQQVEDDVLEVAPTEEALAGGLPEAAEGAETSGVAETAGFATLRTFVGFTGFTASPVVIAAPEQLAISGTTGSLKRRGWTAAAMPAPATSN